MRLTRISDKLIWLLTVFLVVSFYIFESYSWGKYILLVVAVSIFIISLLQGKRLSFNIQPFHCFVFIFAGFCFMSSLWAISMIEAISKAFTIIQILICLSLVYIHYQKVDSIQPLINAIMWAGYIIGIYSFIFYGGFEDVFALLTSGNRLANDYTNVNSIGLICAVACVIQVYRFMYVKFSWSGLFMIPAILMIAATQSRKALVILLMGILAVIVIKNLSNKYFFKSCLKIIAYLAIAVLALYFILQLEIFSGINERMKSWFVPIFGEGQEDHSAWLRRQYIYAGWEQFLKTPILGIGIGNAGILTEPFGTNTYLHNNFIELLACGGIFGFVFYYSIYIYIYSQIFKYRKYDKKGFAICVILLTIFLIMDYGMVSYYSKNQYFYFMIFFLEVRHMKVLAKSSALEKVNEQKNNNCIGEVSI